MKILKLIISTIILLSVVSESTFAQPYVDVAKIQYNTLSTVTYDSTTSTLGTKNLTGSIFLPLELKNDDVIIVGAKYNRYDLAFEGDTSGTANLAALSLNLGGIKKWNDGKWSLMMVIIPKISSDFKSINKNHLQLGGAGLLTYKKSEKFKLKAGLYYNREFFGNQFVPLLGFEWKANERLNIYGMLPNAMNIEYKVSPQLYIGYSYKSFLGTYRLSGNDDKYYVRDGHRSFGHIQNKVFVNVYPAKNIALFSEIGYTTGRRLELYENGQENRNTPVSNPIYMKASDGLFINMGVAFRVRLDIKDATHH